MAPAFDHEHIRENEDRSQTLALLDEARLASTSEAERPDAFRTLAFLEDYRSIEPLTAIVEDQALALPVRRAASEVLAGFDDSTTGERRRGWWASRDPVLSAHALRLMDRSEADIVTAVAGDDAHPLQALALKAMAFGFDEAEFQPVKIRALRHPDADVRAAAADVLVWDEPVEAEAPLLTATSDRSGEVAVAAVDTLQYYPSRRVLRVLAQLAQSDDNKALRAKAAESLDYNRGRFEYCATCGDRRQVQLLREWMEPVADIIRWSAEIPRPEASPRPSVAHGAMPEGTLVALLNDLDGEWAPKKQALREVAWEAYSTDERERLCEMLVTHPDPVVRSIGALPLATWSRAEALLALATDASFSVRKSAMYHLRTVPRDPAVAAFAWEYMRGVCGTTAYEALQTYVTHAPSDEAKQRLVALGRVDSRESVRTTAISGLADLRAARDLETLTPLLREPPGVSWAVHIQLIDGLRALGLSAPNLDDLAEVDNLDLIQSIVALRCSPGR
jgi:HEAT repeat protein